MLSSIGYRAFFLLCAKFRRRNMCLSLCFIDGDGGQRENDVHLCKSEHIANKRTCYNSRI